MKFEDLFEEWKKDSDIDRAELSGESLKIPKLHHKYYTYMIAEKSTLKKLESQFKQLKLSKYEFFTQGHTEETRALKWEMPAKGLILKADIPMYIDADKDIIDITLKVGMQQEKVEFLESIIKSFQTRGYLIKNAIDFIKFCSGA